MDLLTRFYSVFSRSPKNEVSELGILLKRADEIARFNGREGLVDLQRLIARKLQSEHMSDAYFKPAHGAIPSLDACRHFGINLVPGANQHFDEFILDNRSLPMDELPRAKLGRDIVLPTCWHPSSILQSIGRIGEGLKWGKWTQDHNHDLMYWYPLNIFWVGGGNHSITQGIIRAEGEIKARSGFDLTDLYRYVRFDGIRWVDTETDQELGYPRYKEFGYIYEVGRYLIEGDN